MRLHSLILGEQLRRLGLPGLAGALLLALSGAWQVAALGPAQAAVAGLQARLAQAQLRQQRIERGLEPAPAAPGQQLERLRRDLPQQLEATSAIDRIYALARREGIEL